jgi:hypothetical protein
MILIIILFSVAVTAWVMCRASEHNDELDRFLNGKLMKDDKGKK